MWSADLLIAVTLAFLIAGFIKGVVGFALPLVALTLLAAVIGLKQAIVLMLAPAFLTNVWQAFAGGYFKQIVRRLWPLLVMAVIGIWIGVRLLAMMDGAVSSALLGVMLTGYSAYSLATPQITPPGRYERWLNPVIGGLSGLSFGLTGTIMVPGVLYIQALGLTRDVLVQTLGIVFLTVTVALSLCLSQNGLLPPKLGLLSLLAMLPTAAGMWLGRRTRKRLSEELFRTLFFVTLLTVGLYLVGRSIL